MGWLSVDQINGSKADGRGKPGMTNAQSGEMLNGVSRPLSFILKELT
jgi:hypothetical protein